MKKYCVSMKIGPHSELHVRGTRLYFLLCSKHEGNRRGRGEGLSYITFCLNLCTTFAFNFCGTNTFMQCFAIHLTIITFEKSYTFLNPLVYYFCCIYKCLYSWGGSLLWEQLITSLRVSTSEIIIIFFKITFMVLFLEWHS